MLKNICKNNNMHLKKNCKWKLKYVKVSNYKPHKMDRMVNTDSQNSQKEVQSYIKLETKRMTAP